MEDYTSIYDNALKPANAFAQKMTGCQLISTALN